MESQFIRKCPKCNKELIYSNRRGLKRAEKNMSLCYNCCKQGEKNSFYGKHHNELVKIKIGKFHKKQISWNEGMIMPKEFRDKLSKHFKEKFKSQKHPWVGRHHKQSSKEKISLSKIGKPTKRHSSETLIKMSNSLKNAWKEGRRNVNPIWKSKGHIEIADLIRNLGYDIKEEYFINGRPFDIFVKDKNLIIEFNGTYWHRDPRKFDENYYHLSHKRTAKQQWKYDEEKINLAKNNGYNIKTIWEMDWKYCKDKKKLLCDILEESK